jgi:HSP90 family molecular chaperone
MPKLKKVLTNQVLRELENLAKNNAEKYQTFWQEFGGYIKQGLSSYTAEDEKLHSLLRFKTNLHPDTWSSLKEYVSHMKEGQKFIYYIVGDDPKSVMRSPHLDYFHSRGTEVLLLTEPMDSFMLMGLRKHGDFDLRNVAQAEIEDAEKPKEEKEEEKISDADFNSLIERFKQVLGERVTDVRASSRLSQSVARLVDPDGTINPELQRVYRYLGKEYEVPKKILELNPSHGILKNLLQLDSGSDLQTAIIEQIYDSALLVEGLHPDPSSIAPRVQQIIEAALAKNSK